MPIWSLRTPIYVLATIVLLLRTAPVLAQWGYLETQAINEIRPGTACEYNRDCAIISTGLKCLRGGCHCEYFRAEPYLDWTHPYYSSDLHKCVIRLGEVCVYNITAAQAQIQHPRAQALMPVPGAGPGRRPATSPSSAWKDYHYTCEPDTWCDPNQPLLESRGVNGVCVRGAAMPTAIQSWCWRSAVFGAMSTTICLKLLLLNVR